MNKCNTPTCPLPVFASRKDDPSKEDSPFIYYCISHAMEYAQIMKNKENLNRCDDCTVQDGICTVCGYIYNS